MAVWWLCISRDCCALATFVSRSIQIESSWVYLDKCFMLHVWNSAHLYRLKGNKQSACDVWPSVVLSVIPLQGRLAAATFHASAGPTTNTPSSERTPTQNSLFDKLPIQLPIVFFLCCCQTEHMVNPPDNPWPLPSVTHSRIFLAVPLLDPLQTPVPQTDLPVDLPPFINPHR